MRVRLADSGRKGKLGNAGVADSGRFGCGFVAWI